MPRLVTDILELPYNFNQIKIQQNELAIADNISAPLLKLQDNLDYLVNQTTIGNLSIAYSAYMFSRNQLMVQEGEFNSDFTINKALLKSIYNHIFFRNRLHSRFIIVNNVLIGIRNIFEYTPVYNFTVSLENLVGINELHSTEVLNRTFQILYDLQLSMLELCKGVEA